MLDISGRYGGVGRGEQAATSLLDVVFYSNNSTHSTTASCPTAVSIYLVTSLESIAREYPFVA